MTDCNGVKTPLPQNIRLFTPALEDACEIEQYRAAVGMLNFLSVQTRPNIAYAVNFLARFNSRHNDTHWSAVKHLLRYVKRTLSTCLTFGLKKA